MIEDLRLNAIFNSSGHRTINIEVVTERGVYSAVSKPILDNSIKEKFSYIRSKIIGEDERDWAKIDDLLINISRDGYKIGPEMALLTSIAISRAATNNNLFELGTLDKFPLPLSNVISGETDWREFFLLPCKAKDPSQAIELLIEAHSVIGDELKRRDLLLGKDMQNCWISKLDDIKILEFLSSIAEDWGMKMGINFSASRLWNGKLYDYNILKKALYKEKQVEFVIEIAKKYNIFYLEDPLDKHDLESFSILRSELNDRLIAGNELYAGLERLILGIKNSSTNGIVIQPEQIGPLSQVKKIVKLVQKNSIMPILHAKTGDDWLSDISAAWGIPIIKAGVLGNDTAKINRLLRIWGNSKELKMSSIKL